MLNNHPNNGILTRKQQNIHVAVQICSAWSQKSSTIPYSRITNFLDFCFSSTKRDIQYFFFTIIRVPLQSIVQLVYIIPIIQYHFSREAHFADTNCSYDVGPGSVVSIATAYSLDGPGIESRWVRGFAHLSRPALRRTPPLM